MKTLVLNAGYEPLSVVSFRRAVILVLSGKARVLLDGGELVRSQTVQMAAPAVIILNQYVRPPRRQRTAASRRGILRRDRNRCAYCAEHASTIDHVMPRSRGGGNTWENLVACCRDCNATKGDRTPAEMGWTLRITPRQPELRGWHIPEAARGEPQWAAYLSFAQAA